MDAIETAYAIQFVPITSLGKRNEEPSTISFLKDLDCRQRRIELSAAFKGAYHLAGSASAAAEHLKQFLLCHSERFLMRSYQQRLLSIC